MARQHSHQTMFRLRHIIVNRALISLYGHGWPVSFRQFKRWRGLRNPQQATKQARCASVMGWPLEEA